MGLGRFLADGLVWIANRLHPGYRNIEDVIRDNIAIWDGDGPKINAISDAPPAIAAMYLDWQNAQYLHQAYDIRKSLAETPHRAGGPPLHQGAICQLCSRPLANFWTLDGSTLSENMPEVFSTISKLTFYHCPYHGNATNYRIVNDEKIEVFPGEHLHDESPFEVSDEEPAPQELSIGYLEIRSIPRALANLLAITNKYDSKYLLESEKVAIHNFLEFNEADSRLDFSTIGQLGGVLHLWQGEEQHVCPNQNCPLSQKIGRSVLVDEAIRKAYRMKQLAVVPIINNPDFPDCYHQLAVHICWNCHCLKTSCVVD